MKNLRKIANSKLIIPAVIILISLLAIWPFFQKGYFESHDGEWMVIRFSAFHQSLRSGQFPVRYVERLNNNYGYSVLNFLYPLPFYLSEIPKIVGFNFVDSVKVTFVISTLISILAMYWALSQYFKNTASFTGSVLYLFAPYRFVDLYVRGSLGENMAFAIVPFILGSIFKISKDEQIYFPLLSLSVALLIVAHNVIAILFIPFFIVLTFTLSKKSFLKSLVFITIGILISSFFWMPALFDLQFVRLSQIKVSEAADHLIPFSKLIYSKWGFGAIPSQPDGFSAQIGVLSAVIFIATLYLSFKNKQKNLFINVLIVIFLLSIFFITPFSSYIWKNIPFIDVIQFPWRILSLIVFITAVFSAYLVDKIGKSYLWILIICTAIISTLIYTKPNVFVKREEGFYTTNESSTTVKDEYLPLWVKEKPASRSQEKVTIPNNSQIIEKNIGTLKYSMTIESQQDSSVQINTIYFPGFKAKLDGKNVPIEYDNPYGLMQIKLPKGTHNVIINFGKTPVHLTSEIISLNALLITGFLFIYSWRKKVIS